MQWTCSHTTGARVLARSPIRWRRVLPVIAGFTVLLPGAGAVFGQSLSITASPASVAPGATLSVSISIAKQSGVAPAGLQWTLNYPASDLQLQQSAAGSAATAAGKTLNCSVTSGSTGCVLSGLNANTIADGVVASFTFKVPSGVSVTSTNAVVAQVTAVSAIGDPVAYLGGTRTAMIGITVSSAPACTYAISPTSQSIAAAGGSGTASVTAGTGCAWTATSSVSWVAISGATNGSGNGSVLFSVAANTGPSRSGTLTIAGQTFSISQASGAATPPAQTCTYSINPSSQTFAAAGGTGTVNVSAPAGCAWTVSNSVSWVSFAGGSGTGSGSANYAVATNTGLARTGVITVAGQSFTVSQGGAANLTSTSSPAGTFAHLAIGGTWRTTLTLINMGTSPANIQLDFYDESGNPLVVPYQVQTAPVYGLQQASSVSRTLNPGASLVAQVGIGQASVAVGSARLTSTGSVGGFAIFTNTSSNQEAVVPLEPRTEVTYWLPFDNTSKLSTGLAIANTSSQAVSVGISIRDDRGAALGTDTISLPPHGHRSFMLPSNYSATANKRGTVSFQSPGSGQVAVVGLRANGPAFTSLPAISRDLTAGGGSLAQLAAGGGWSTSFTLVNPDNLNAAPASLVFLDDSGAPLQLPLRNRQTGAVFTASQTNDTLSPASSLLLETTSAASPYVLTGFARTASSPVSGFGIYRYEPTGQEASVPLETRNAASYFLAFDNSQGRATGAAIANMSDLPATVRVNLKDEAGNSLGTSTISLGARGHASFMLTGINPSTAGRIGTAEFVTPPGGRISVLGLRETPNQTLTSIPVQTR
jgi:hypothetical protein